MNMSVNEIFLVTVDQEYQNAASGKQKFHCSGMVRSYVLQLKVKKLGRYLKRMKCDTLHSFSLMIFIIHWFAVTYRP
jgi:hypothetical protein